MTAVVKWWHATIHGLSLIATVNASDSEKNKVPISRGAEPANRDFTMSSDVGRHLSQLQDDLSLAAIPPS